MFNPFKVQLSCDNSIRSEERERFLEFVSCQLLIIGCDRVWQEWSKVQFSNEIFSFSRERYHMMAGVDGGTIFFSPFSNQIVYEYRSTTLGILMVFFAVFAFLLIVLNSATAGFFPFVFLFFLAVVITVNRAVIRRRQNRFLQQLVPAYERMKKVFSPSGMQE